MGVPKTTQSDSDARAAKPKDVAVDKDGNVYIADTKTSVVRKVDGATLIVTTFAGDGTEGYSGDGGPAVSAELTNTLSVAVSGSRSVHIGGTTKNFGSGVRKVDGSYRITSWREVAPQ